MPIINNVIGRDIVNGRRALGFVHINNSREHLIVNNDLFSRVFGLRVGIRNHNSHMIANITHFALRECRMGTCLHRRAVLVVDHPTADQAADFIRSQIVACQNAQHTRSRFCGRDIKLLDGGMSMG